MFKPVKEGRRAYIKTVGSDKDKEFIATIAIDEDDCDFIGWSYNGHASKALGISYTISDDNDVVIGIILSEYATTKLWKQLRRDEIYTFVEDYINITRETYKDIYGERKIIIEIPYNSKTLSLLYRKSGFKPTTITMESV